jgi:hypothetical protein
MSIARKILGPESKYDQSIPYTYKARITPIEGDEDIFDDCFSDTICGLIEYLETNAIPPDSVRLFGVYRGEELPLDIRYCLSPDGAWLERPDICHALEQHFLTTLEEQYRGHVEHGACSYEDRDRKGSGPF